MVLQNFSTARTSGNISWHTEKLFSSDTRQSMKRRITTKRLFTIYIARCGYTWLDESKWPQEWPISPITIITWRFQEKRWNLSVYTRLGFESWYKQIPKLSLNRCGYTWLDESKWPQEWPISPITIITWRFQEKRWNLSVYTRLGFESWYKQIPKLSFKCFGICLYQDSKPSLV